MQKKHVYIFIAVITAIFFCFGTAGASFSIEDERKLGKEFYDNLEKNKLIYHNRKVEDYLNKIGQSIVSVIPQSPFEYHFYIIKSSAINAFATPGGYVYLNAGLIELAGNESELAGVLSHEIAHVAARHIAEIIKKSKKVNMAALAAVLTGAFLGGGDVTAAVTGFSLATMATLNLKYSREHEEEADRLGMNYMTKAGYDTSSMLDFLRVMRKYEYYSSNVPSYFLTHPVTEERIRYLDGLIQIKHAQSGSKNPFNKLRRIQTLLMLDLKNPNTNLSFFKTSVRENVEDIDYVYGLAVTEEKLGMIEKALENFHKILQEAPNDTDVLREIGIIYFKKGNIEDALNYLSKALKNDESDEKAALHLGKAYETQSDYASALQVYKRLKEGNPDSMDVNYNIATAYGKINKLGESHYHFGIYFEKKKKYDSALFHFTAALPFFTADSPQAKHIKEEIKKIKSKES